MENRREVFLFSILRGKKRPRGTPDTRWIDEIKCFSGTTWMRSATHIDSEKMGTSNIELKMAAYDDFISGLP